MQFSAEKYEKQSSYVIQSTEYNNLLHVHKVRAQSEKLLKGVNIHGLTLCFITNSVTVIKQFTNQFDLVGALICPIASDTEHHQHTFVVHCSGSTARTQMLIFQRHATRAFVFIDTGSDAYLVSRSLILEHSCHVGHSLVLCYFVLFSARLRRYSYLNVVVYLL